MKHSQKLLPLVALVIISFTHAWGQCEGPCKDYNESPVNIVARQTLLCSDDPLKTDFPVASSDFSVFYDAVKHNVKLKPIGPSKNSVTFHGAHYTLSEIHAHDTTEHVVDGSRPSCELHLVFSLEDGDGSKNLVIGIRGNYTAAKPAGAADMITTRIITGIAETGRRRCAHDNTPAKISISLNSYQSGGLLNNYVTYCGSLTSFPYNKIVTWIECLDVVKVYSPDGVNILQKGMCPNTIDSARALQRLTVPVYRVSRK